MTVKQKRDSDKPFATIHPRLAKYTNGRIIIIGFKHPYLADVSYTTASPAMSLVARMVGLQLT